MRISRVTISASLFLQMAVLGTAAQAQTTTVAGTTPSQFSVSQTGAAIYRIPIQVPPGVAGMEPKLELVYNSQSGNGFVGKGWGLAGLSAITRCPRTKASDGVMGTVRFDANDRFCLDGQRLILVSGTYGAAASEYRTERERFSSIAYDGNAFAVKTKEGLTQQYGATADASVEVQGKSVVRTWAINKIVDVAGNYLTISYTEDNNNGDYRPSRIDYTGSAGQVPVNSVQLEYADRTDITPQYWLGTVSKTMKRLTKVKTYSGANLTKEYRLDYATQATALDKSQLTAVAECDSTGACMPAHTSNWGAPGNNSFATPSNWIASFGTSAGGWSDSVSYPRKLIDINGDGMIDVVGFGGSGVMVSLNTGSALGATTTWLAAFGVSAGGWTDNNTMPREVVDVNGDGLPDIVGFGPSGVMVALNTGTSFAAATNWVAGFGTSAGGWTNNNTMPRQVVDMNGDGLPDIAGFNATGLSVALNTGSSFATPTNWISNQFGTNQNWTDNEITPRQLVDVNGDGLPDIVGFARGGALIALNTGEGFVSPNYACSGGSGVSGFSCTSAYTAPPVWGCADPSHRLVGSDEGTIWCTWGPHSNGYAPAIVLNYACPTGGSLYGTTCTVLTSLTPSFTCPAGYAISGSSCALSGVSGALPVTWQLSDFGTTQGWADSRVAPRYVVDVNGDGLPDIVGFGPSGVMVALNTGIAFAPATSWIADFGTGAGWSNYNTYPRQLVDVNGDGLPDIVGFGPNGVMVALNTRASFVAAANWITAFTPNAGGWSSNTAFPRQIVDMNGDGVPDAVGFGPSGVMVGNSARNLSANYVASVANGMGASNAPSYTTLAFPGTHVRDSGANKATFPMIDLSLPLTVVSSVSTNNAIGGLNVTNYSYGGLKAELGTGRGMLGFRWVKSKEMATGVERYTEYRQDWPYVGMTVKAETRLAGAGNAGVLKRTTATLACKIPLNGSACVIQSRCDLSANSAACQAAATARYFPYVAGTQEEGWDINGAAYPTTTTTIDYGVDAVDGKLYGDPSTITVSTNDGATKSTVNEYYPADTTNWLLGRLKKSTVTSVKP
jgi:hypothetical protein